jgi:hypothetical protein
MIVGRIIGWLLVACAAAALGFEVVRYLQAGEYRVIAAGQLWFDLHRGSLNLAQAVVQRHLHPLLWDAGVAPVLQLPAWAVLGAPGLLLVWLCRPRRRHSFGT